MKKFVFDFVLVLLGVLSLSFTGCKNEKLITPPKQYAVEDFFKNPEKTDYQLSPDGRYYAYLSPYMRRMNIFVQEIGKESVIQLTKDTARDISGFFWGNNNRILYLKDSGGDENFKLFGVNTDGSNLTGLTDFDKVRTEIIDPLPEIDEFVIVGLNKRNPSVFDPYRLNINTGELTILAENPGNIQGWLTDHNGKLRAAVAIVDGVNTSLLFREAEDAPFATVLTTSFKETMAPHFFTFDNKNLYASSNLGRDKNAIVEFDPRTGKEVNILYQNPEYDVDGLYYSEARKILTTARYTSWKRERFFFDKEYETLFGKLKSELGDLSFEIVSNNKAEDQFIIRSYTDKSLGAYFLFDKKADVISKISDVSPWLDENEMGKQFPVEYTSRDGLTIHGYLTLPKGYSLETAKNLPVVINPHGGPWYRDEWGYNPEVQFLANRGYAVFQMNFRGSTGYGRAFWEASFKQWGKNMQNDITDGVNWLIEKGIADKTRIAIYGASYGGYATLAGVTFTPDLYAAAVDYVGVSNLFTFMETIPPYWETLLAMLHEMVGNPVTDSLLLRETSPVFHVDKIVTPLFVAQGANDPRVNINESNQMVEALKNRGVDVEYMVKDNEGHGFQNEENRYDFYHAMEKFLGEHLKAETEKKE